MEKNIYMAPAIEVVEYSAEDELLTVSGNNGIGYGGVDNGGAKDPASRLIDGFDLED